MSESIDEQKRINPQVTEVEIGIRDLRKVTVYPLSMADQLTLTDIVSKAIAEHVASMQQGGSDIEVVALIVKILRDNLPKILSMVTDENGDEMLGQMSNLQFAAIVETIYETNYGIVAKNFESLFGKLKALFLSERPSPPSVSDMGIDLTTSTESPGGTEASPSDS